MRASTLLILLASLIALFSDQIDNKLHKKAKLIFLALCGVMALLGLVLSISPLL